MSKIKVLLVDDEPFIRQGMRMIIDWESYGYEIAAEAENGIQALEILDSEEIDLAFVDMKMPGMSGLELIKTAQEKGMELYFVVLTGYADFSYAREALRLAVEDYLLKPIQKEELTDILERVKEEKEKDRNDNIELVLNHELDIHLSHILLGKYMETDLEIVNQYMPRSDRWQYVSFEFEKKSDVFRNMTAEERKSLQKQCVTEMRYILRDWQQQVVSSLHEEEQLTDAGVLLIPQMYKEQQMEVMEYVAWLQKRLQARTGRKTQVYVGTAVSRIADISQSYYSIRLTRCMHEFADGSNQPVAVGEKSENSRPALGMRTKDIEELVEAVRANNGEMIAVKVQQIYEQIQNSGFNLNVVQTKLYYLLYRLVNLANELDNEANQEEILKHIGQKSFDKIVLSGTADELTEFVCAYAKYLERLRKVESEGVLGQVEQYVRQNYSQNISLKSIGEQFYINNVYLGQIFKKKNGVAFKEYLNRIRIEKAAGLLKDTDEKIYTIAEKVGFHNTDYFINRFVQEKGITPRQYRMKAKKGQNR